MDVLTVVEGVSKLFFSFVAGGVCRKRSVLSSVILAACVELSVLLLAFEPALALAASMLLLSEPNWKSLPMDNFLEFDLDLDFGFITGGWSKFILFMAFVSWPNRFLFRVRKAACWRFGDPGGVCDGKFSFSGGIGRSPGEEFWYFCVYDIETSRVSSCYAVLLVEGEMFSTLYADYC